MKRKLVVLFLLSTLLVYGCSKPPADETFETPESSEEIVTETNAEIIVGDPLERPSFTAEQNTSAMVDQIAATAKEYSEFLTEEEASEIIEIIRETDHKFYDGAEDMELFMWYGYLLDYKFDDSDTRSQLGTDLCQAIKYVYRGAETILDDSTQENLCQIDTHLENI